MGGFAMNWGAMPSNSLSLFNPAASSANSGLASATPAFGADPGSGAVPMATAQPDFSSLLGYQQTPGYQTPAMNSGPGGNPLGASSFKFGMNLPSLQVGLSGLQTLSNLWNAFQQTSLAKQQLAYTKQIGNANLTNQIQSYNTNLTDRANSRGVMEGLTPTQTQAYINTNQLNNPVKG